MKFTGMSYLSTVVSKLEEKGLFVEAKKVKDIMEDLLTGEDQSIEDILSSYSRIHTAERHKVITAVIRKGKECPFGLTIPQACKFAGDSITDMCEGHHKINRMIYNTERDHKRCIYAASIMENNKSVECNYGSVLQGKKSVKMFHGNPQYPKMWSGFSGIQLDRGYHAYSQQYGNELFPYPSIYG